MYKLKGGMEPGVNPNWCDGHFSQCKDAYQIYQDGGKNQKLYYKKYKKYKKKIKLLKNI